MQGDVPAADRRGPRAAVGLQHVAVDGDLHLAHGREIGDGAQRTADQALDLLGASGRSALLRFALDPVRVDPGSIEYSAVTQPSLPRSHGGSAYSTDAVHNTRVRPNSTSTSRP